MGKKEVVIFVLVLLVSVGVFAETVSDGGVSAEVSQYVEGFLEKGGSVDVQVDGIVEIDQEDLPDEVEIKEINPNNIGIYQVNYTEEQEAKKVFLVTYTTNEFREKAVAVKNVQYLDFGFAGSSTESGYLETSTGVGTGAETGYVMMRPGSITGISTTLTLEGEGKVNIAVYKNGKDTGFGNDISSDDKKTLDYDLQSEDIVDYVAGDVISVYIMSENVNWSEVVTLVETTS